MERLTAMDASFFFSEDGRSHNDVGMVLVFDGPALSRAEMAETVMGRIALVPRFRQKIKLVPFAAALPVWVDDTRFDVDRHVLEHVAPACGDPLGSAVSKLMSDQLDHDRPLWEIHLITGLPEDQWSLVVRMHHSMVDGASSMEIIRVLLSPTPELVPAVADSWSPQPEPSDARLVAAAMADAAKENFRVAAAWTDAVLRPPAPSGIKDLQSVDLQPLMTPGLAVANSLINGPIGPGRQWAMTDVPLATIKQLSKAFGGTVNDVALALCTQGFTALLEAWGEEIEGRVVRSIVPVSLRVASGGESSVAVIGNDIGAMVVELPLGHSPIADRLARIRAQTVAFKSLKNAMPADKINPGSDFTTPVTLTLGSRIAASAPALTNTVTTNVPGPQVPLYLCGRRLTRLSACIALWAPLRIAVAILSYDGMITIGVVSDSASIPDVHPVLDAIIDGLHMLAAEADVEPS